MILLVPAVAGVGCAELAKRTPTPAHDIPHAALAGPAPPNERYYAIVFGSQKRWRGWPTNTHTWATVVKATWTDGCAEPEIDAQTISWMPKNFKIHIRPLVVVPGQNLGMHETLAWALSEGQHVAIWGPYEIQPALYRRAMIQKAFLESGTIGYQLVDTMGEAAETGLGCDCIHALTDMDPGFNRGHYPLIFYGWPASRRLVHEAARRGAFIEPQAEHDWILPRLGLDKYPLTRRPQPYVGIRPVTPPGGAGDAAQTSHQSQ